MSRHTRAKTQRKLELERKRQGFDNALNMLKAIHRTFLLNMVDLRRLNNEMDAIRMEKAAQGVAVAIKGVSACQPGLQTSISRDLWADYAHTLAEIMSLEGRAMLIELRTQTRKPKQDD